MESIEALLGNRVKVSDANERRVVIREIYEIYVKDGSGRRKENWKRYCKWCRENKWENSVENQKKFRKTKLFINESPARNLAVKMAHVPTKDLYYIKSVAQDKLNRGEPIGGFIFGSLKAK